MAAQARKSRNFLFTPHFSNEAYADKSDQWFIDTLLAQDCVQAAGGQREKCPQTGNVHMQLFVILKKKKRQSAVVRKQLLGASCNVQMGDGKWEAMLAYCTREFYADDHPDYPGLAKRLEGCEVVQGGTWPQGRGKRNDLMYMIEYAKTTGRKVSYATASVATNGASIRYPRAWEKLLEEQGTKRDFKVPHEGIWYYGEGRIGKSHLAHTEHPDAYIKVCANRWFPGYNGEKTVIYDEFAGKILH